MRSHRLALASRPLAIPLAPAVVSIGFWIVSASEATAQQNQVVFSIDWHGPTIAQPDTLIGAPITEGDILIAPGGVPEYGPLPNPSIRVRGNQLSLSKYSSCVGHAAGTPCGLELDALSDGRDDPLLPLPSGPGRARILFSVDEYSVGIQGPPTPGHADVFTEHPLGESCSDVFADTGLPPGPLPPFASQPHNAGVVDGDGVQGVAGFVYPGIGLVEPNPPTITLPNPGDNLDALDVGQWTTFPSSGVYFSLDSGFSDPIHGAAHSGSAAFEGKRGGDVLRVAFPGAPISVYAQANQLGLDLVGGVDSDDLDALILRDNGNGTYQPSQVAYDWVGGATDMLLFSVRRGSAVVGQLDSRFGIPIAPGDILTTPEPANGSPYPAIFIAAENLGIGAPRSGTGHPGGDDLDALDAEITSLFDCNKNGIEDAVDIAVGSSLDANSNGIPDECESGLMRYCWCVAAYAPCGNDYGQGGCENSTGVGAILNYTGTESIAADDLGLTVTQLPPNINGIIYVGTVCNPPMPFNDGDRCVYGSIYRLPLKNAGAGGTFSYGPGIVTLLETSFPITITPGSTWGFQGWYRNNAGPCGTGTNMSNALRVIFAP